MSFATSFDSTKPLMHSPDAVKEAAALIAKVASYKASMERLAKDTINPPKDSDRVTFHLSRSYHNYQGHGYIHDNYVTIEPKDIRTFIEGLVEQAYNRLVELGVDITSL